MKYKFFPHTADIKFQAFGESLEEAFENSALALSESIYEGEVEKNRDYAVQAKGSDLKNLLLNFLEEFLVLFDSENFVLSKVQNLEIEKSGDKYEIKSDLLGDDTRKYEISEHVKAITYNEMIVEKSKEKSWKTQVVLDV